MPTAGIEIGGGGLDWRRHLSRFVPIATDLPRGGRPPPIADKVIE
jgi:hypothetical protein